ncbi:MAG: hypothetical protein RL215_1468 [Planctomycetota bacterium]
MPAIAEVAEGAADAEAFIFWAVIEGETVEAGGGGAGEDALTDAILDGGGEELVGEGEEEDGDAGSGVRGLAG